MRKLPGLSKEFHIGIILDQLSLQTSRRDFQLMHRRIHHKIACLCSWTPLYEYKG